MTQEKKEKITCSSCGKEKNSTDFYASSSPFHKYTSRLHVCKECFWEFIDDDVDKLKIALRMIDRPFLKDILDASKEESENSNKNLIKTYMKNIGMVQYKDLTWDDSDFEGHKTITELDNSLQNEEYDITDDAVRYWGRNYEDWEYEFLENERFKLISSFECPDYGMEMIMKDICFINLEIEKVRQDKKDNSSKTITNLIKTRSDLMNDANMKPIQSTGAEANDQITFGTLIKKWENERPVPKPLDDEMKRYIDTFMVGHLAKMEGLHNDLTEKYEKAISEYTIEFNEINKSEELEDL